MFTALFSFLGGTAFRLIFGAVMDWLNKRQDHQAEMDTMRLQDELEDKRHNRNTESIRLQAELGVKQIEVQTAGAISTAEANAFVEAVRATRTVTGIGWVDAWNQAIRPAGASVSLAVWIATMMMAGFVLTDFDQTLISAFLGIFVGERIHAKLRG